MRLLKPNNSGSSISQIAIKEIRDNVLVLDERRYRMVLETSSINLELKSEAEQDALIEIYQSFLNSLDSSIQIIVRTREINLDNFIEVIDHQIDNERAQIYKRQLENYRNFIKGLVNVNRILSRSFYVVVSLDIEAKQDFNFVKEQLELRTDIVIKGLQRMGLHVRALDGLDIANLFYLFYSPDEAKAQPLKEAVLNKMHFALIKGDT